MEDRRSAHSVGCRPSVRDTNRRPSASSTHQPVVVKTLRHKVEEMAGALDDALGVRRAGGNIHSDRALDNHFVIANLELDLEAG